MEWTPEIAVTVGGVFVGLIMVFSSLVAAFVLIVKKLGERADSALLGLMSDQNEAQAKRDEAQTRQDEIQVENSRLQAEAFASLAASQESQAKSLEYIGQLHQGASAALTVMMDQLRPLPPMVTAIQSIQAQNSELSVNVEQMSKSQEQLLKEIIQRLDGVQKTLDEMNPRLKETEQEVAIIRGQVIEIQKTATQEPVTPAVSHAFTEAGNEVEGSSSIATHVWDVDKGEITGGAVGTSIDVEFPEPKPETKTEDKTNV